MLLLKFLFHLLEFALFYIINRKSIIPKIALIWQENHRYKRYFNEKNVKLPFFPVQTTPVDRVTE
ncbi:MAG: hypothetical protein JEY99_04555 [Spirochaetales bacterium]|nr:hypothetical protein [Spirochaetales bacterium]